MPIYEYRCEQCGQVSEFIQKISEAPQTRCPHCQSESLKKLVSSTRFQLKGTGWYETDFKKPPEKAKPEEKEKKTPPPSTETTDKNS